MSAISEKISERTESGSLADSRHYGQIPCVLVFSDRKHVPYINQIVNCLEEVLPSLGFKVNKLCDKTPPDKHFGESFEKLAKECVLGIVVLDGYRPNVLFEYGFLRGRGKVVIPLQEKKACIAIKGLYSIADLSNGKDIKNNTGLTQSQFTNLREPLIRHFGQFSDRHGINVIEVDCDAPLTSAEHPKSVIETEIRKLRSEILQKHAQQSLKSVKQKTPEYLGKFQKATLKILQYYTHAIPFKYRDIEKSLREIRELERQSNINLPSSTYGIIASLYETLAEQASPLNTGETDRLYRKTIDLLEKIVKIETDSLQCTKARLRIGNVYHRLSDVRDEETNLNKAIKVYKEALSIYTKKDYPTDYATIQHNLGTAYGRLSDVRDEKTNLNNAIKAFKEALSIYTKKDYPTDYARIQNNFGTAYGRLSDVRDEETNLNKAIKAFKEALSIITKKDYPTKYAMTQNNLGNAISRLSGVRDEKTNLNKAIKAFKEALSIYTKKDYPTKYAMTHNNFGTAYRRLSGVRDKETNLNNAIKAYKEALSIITKKDYPTKYAMTQFNLGIAYGRLSGVRDEKTNLNNAIKAYKEALSIYTKKDYPTKYARIQNNFGTAYGRLSDVRDKETNLNKAIKAFKEALSIYTKKDYPTDYAMTQNNLGNAISSLSGVRDEKTNLNKAIKAFKEALSIYTKKDYPTKYAIVMRNLEDTRELLGTQ